VDGIDDSSKLCQGIPVAPLLIFGVAPLINTTNYVDLLALEKFHALQNAQAMQV
jgi:hypothetical protein